VSDAKRLAAALSKRLSVLEAKPLTPALCAEIKKALDNCVAEDLKKWSLVTVECDPDQDLIAKGEVRINVGFRPQKPAETIHLDFTIDTPPPEPSMIDRIAALDSREAAWRCFEYDRWIEGREKAAS